MVLPTMVFGARLFVHTGSLVEDEQTHVTVKMNKETTSLRIQQNTKGPTRRVVSKRAGNGKKSKIQVQCASPDQAMTS